MTAARAWTVSTGAALALIGAVAAGAGLTSAAFTSAAFTGAAVTGKVLIGAVDAGMASARVPSADVGFTSRLGASVDGTAVFLERGRPVTLRSLLQGRPTLLIPGYFHCPNLCSTVRTDAIRGLVRSGLDAGSDYSLIAVSIDPRETPADAEFARERDLSELKSANPANGAAALAWHYLTGDSRAIAALSQAIGFAYRFDAVDDQYVHPPGLVVLTPQGIVSDYVLGVGYQPGSLREAVRRANGGAVATAFSPLVLLCFNYDAHTGRYSLAVVKVLRVAAVLTVIVTASLLYRAHRQQKFAS